MGVSEHSDPWAYIQDQTREMRERMQAVVDEYYADEYFEAIGEPEDVIAHEFPHFAWREFFLGCLPPNRQLHQIYVRGDPFRGDVDLVLGLNKQIRDELKHSKIFANYCEEFDIYCDLSYPERTIGSADELESLIAMTRSTVEHDDPHVIAGLTQCGTEIMAAQMADNLAGFLEADYPGIADALHGVSADEGDHIHVGRLIFARYADASDIPELRERLETKFETAVEVLRVKKREVAEG